MIVLQSGPTGRRFPLVAGLIAAGFAAISGPRCSAQAIPSLSEIVANVRANEALYSNIEVQFTEEYRTGEPSKYEVPGKTVQEQRRASRLVKSGRLFRFNETLAIRIDMGVKRSIRMEAGYDGEKTIHLRPDFAANIREERTEVTNDLWLLSPFLLVNRRNDEPNYSFSQYLEGGEDFVKIREAHPNFTGTSAFRRSVEGAELVSGLKCVRVSMQELDAKTKAPTGFRRVFSLCSERNFIPIKLLLYSPMMGREVPSFTAEADDMREIAPGVWYPFEIRMTSYDEHRFRDEKKISVKFTETLRFQKAALDPDYPKSFYAVAIPNGTPVYVVKDGKIVESYVQGAKPGGPSRSRSRFPWLLGSVSLLSICVASVVFVRRRAAKRTLPLVGA